MHIGLVIAKVATLILGVSIAYQAYRGYRRHQSTRMFYFAIGFTFVSIGAVVEGILYDVIGLSIFVAGTVQTTIVALGMVGILYSLYSQS